MSYPITAFSSYASISDSSFPPFPLMLLSSLVYSLFAKSELSVLQESASTLLPPFSIIVT